MARTVAAGRNKAWGISIPMPAPGDLRLIQDLVNTRDVTGADNLPDPAQLADWMVSQGSYAADQTLSAADHRRVMEFREGLRALLSTVDRERLDVKIIERINRAALGARVRLRLEPDGTPRIDSPAGGLDHAFGRWMGILVHADAEGHWTRLKICVNPECRVAYFDGSRSRGRRWCTRRCGDAVRSRTYRRTDRYKRSRHDPLRWDGAR